MGLIDVLREAGGGNAFRLIADTYGVSEADVRRAAEAFLPAFSAGIKQSTASLPGLSDFMRGIAAGAFANAFLNPASIDPGGSTGADALRILFGGADATQSIVEQASAFSGIPEERLRILMAPLAAMTLGGVARQATVANPFLDDMLKQFGMAEPERPKAAKGPLDKLEEEQVERERAAERVAELQRGQQQMMEAGLAAFQAGTAAWQKAMSDLAKAGKIAGEPTDEPRIQGSGRDLFGEMFEPGLRISEAYQREMEALVERLRGGKASG